MRPRSRPCRSSGVYLRFKRYRISGNRCRSSVHVRKRFQVVRRRPVTNHPLVPLGNCAPHLPMVLIGTGLQGDCWLPVIAGPGLSLLSHSYMR